MMRDSHEALADLHSSQIPPGDTRTRSYHVNTAVNPAVACQRATIEHALLLVTPRNRAINRDTVDRPSLPTGANAPDYLFYLYTRETRRRSVMAVTRYVAAADGGGVANYADAVVEHADHPCGLALPEPWLWPRETRHVTDGYPQFEQFRQWVLSPSVEAPAATIKYWHRGLTGGDSESAANYVYTRAFQCVVLDGNRK